MSRRDPGAANGGRVRAPRKCRCGRAEALHPLRNGQRAGLPSLGCERFEPATTVLIFPGVGTTPAPGPRAVPADLDAMGERYVAYCEARDSGREQEADLLARAVADDTPAWLGEVARVEALRQELADELNRIRGGA